MLNAILTLIYSFNIGNINRELLDKYVYCEVLYFKSNGYVAYNWRRIEHDLELYNTLYTLKDDDRHSVNILPLRMRRSK